MIDDTYYVAFNTRCGHYLNDDGYPSNNIVAKLFTKRGDIEEILNDPEEGFDSKDWVIWELHHMWTLEPTTKTVWE